MVVFGLGKNLLFKSILGRCDGLTVEEFTISCLAFLAGGGVVLP